MCGQRAHCAARLCTRSINTLPAAVIVTKGQLQGHDTPAEFAEQTGTRRAQPSLYGHIFYWGPRHSRTDRTAHPRLLPQQQAKHVPALPALGLSGLEARRGPAAGFLAGHRMKIITAAALAGAALPASAAPALADGGPTAGPNRILQEAGDGGIDALTGDPLEGPPVPLRTSTERQVQWPGWWTWPPTRTRRSKAAENPAALQPRPRLRRVRRPAGSTSKSNGYL